MTARCAHCRGNTLAPEEEAAAEHAELANTKPWFHAVHPGVCAACGEPFTPGTPIRMHLPHGWRAACCTEEATP